MSSSSKSHLNPHAPEYKPISPGISPNNHPHHAFSLLSLLENAAVSSPPPSYFSAQIFTYVGPPPPPFSTTYYFSNPVVDRRHFGQRRRTDFGQSRGFRAGGRGRGRGTFNRTGGFFMNERICNNNNNNNNNNNITNNNKNVIWLKKEQDKKIEEKRDEVLKRDQNNTTVMIKNIPYHCPREELIHLLDRFCMSENAKDWNEGGTSKRIFEESAAYDFFYLPIDFRTKKGRGYAFVNFTNTQTVWKFFNAFHLTDWDSVQWNNWPKKIEIVSAKIQGKEALVNHFAGSVFECETDEYLPLRFDPARDGSGQPVEVTVIGKRRAIPHGGASTRSSNHKTLRRPRLLA